jgi:hypothetical protein
VLPSEWSSDWALFNSSQKNKQKNLQRREKYRLLHGGLLRGAGLLENIVVSRNGCFQSDL